MLIGYRKYSVILLAMGFIFIGWMTGKVDGGIAVPTLAGISTAYAGMEIVKQKILK